VAGQGQDIPDYSQTVFIMSASGEENGNRELAGLQRSDIERVELLRVMESGDSSAGWGAPGFDFGRRNMDALS
jgi:hypothetical protein